MSANVKGGLRYASPFQYSCCTSEIWPDINRAVSFSFHATNKCIKSIYFCPNVLFIVVDIRCMGNISHYGCNVVDVHLFEVCKVNDDVISADCN